MPAGARNATHVPARPSRVRRCTLAPWPARSGDRPRSCALRAHPARLVLRGCVSELVVEAALDHEFMIDGSDRETRNRRFAGVSLYRRPHRTDRCALPLKFPAHSPFCLRRTPMLRRLCPIPTRPPCPLVPTKTPHLRGFCIGALGFEPETSPTRIMGETHPANGKALQIVLL